MDASAQIDNAISHHQAGRLEQAKTLYLQILQSQPQDADALHLLGLVFHQLGEHRAAIDYIQRATAIKPNAATFHTNLGAVYHAAGDLENAVASCQRALQLNPGDAKAYFNLGCAQQTQGKLDQAVANYRTAIRIKPDYIDAHLNLGNSLKDQGKLPEAITSYERAIQIRGDVAKAHNNLGSALRDLGSPAKRIASSRQAVAIAPNYAEAHRNLGLALKDLGRFDEAVASFERAVETRPDYADALADLVQTRRGSNADDTMVAKLQELLASEKLSHDEQRHAHFALGDYHDRCEEWKLAFGHYEQGNSLAETRFDCRRMADKKGALIDTCTSALLERGGELGVSSELPVFIVGMPRSGTSLVEQILASHPSVVGAGELPHVSRYADRLAAKVNSNAGYPACLQELDKETASELAEQYLVHLRSLCTDEVRVTDKMPGNFVHLGLIALLLPRARVIHCRRHPLDVCLSNYFQDFVRRDNLSFSFDLRSLGEYYTQYAQLMEHWRQVLPLPLLEVEYEQLVADPEKGSRQLLEFCGVPWDPACLDFHKTERAVQTASKWQVRQPIYHRSVGRWKHYEQYLGPLRAALDGPSYEGAPDTRPDHAETHRNRARRGSPDPAESADRRSPAAFEDLRSDEWLGQETGHSSSSRRNLAAEEKLAERAESSGDVVSPALTSSEGNPGPARPAPQTISKTFGLAMQHHQAGRLHQAEQLYREVLRVAPQHADALHLLGVIAAQTGKHKIAVELINRAIEVQPENAMFHNNLGNALCELEQVEEGMASYQRAIKISRDLADAHSNLGNALRKLGKRDEAVASYQRALKIKPNFVQAHSNLGATRVEQGRFEEAVACYQRALQINPNHAQAQNSLGHAFKELGKLEAAANCFRRAVEINANFAEAHNNLGATLVEQGKLEEAVGCCQRAVQINPTCAEMHRTLGLALKDLGRLDEAVASYRRALEIEPDYAKAHRGLGLAFKDLGRFPDAVASFEQALNIQPDYVDALADLIQTQGASNADHAFVEQLEQSLAREGLPRDEVRHAHFALGDHYDRCQQWEPAFGHYERGNALADTRFDCGWVADRIHALTETCTHSLLQRGATLGVSSELPVLIVGMPRSGTSLVEQILASHPAVFGAGELAHVGQCVQALPAALKSTVDYPTCLSELDHPTASQLADRYLSQLKSFNPQAVRVTDKAPGNFMHLGLVALLLPRTRIIHCRRHPLDVCLSCYFQDFTDRTNLSFAFDLRNLGLFYREYSKLMEHWRQVLPLPLFEVDYEELVAEPEKMSRQLLEFCGLPWDPACLEFHKTERVVQTASNWQVRQPIYHRSVGRWKHYEKYVGALKEALGRPS